MRSQAQIVTAEALHEPPRFVFVSPHCDDVVWSAGDYLCRLAESCEVVVVTVFGGEGPPESGPRDWRRLAASPVRRRENELAMQRAAVSHVHLDLLDAALRRRGDVFLYSSIEEILAGEPHPCDAALRREISDRLLALTEEDDVVLHPLALGGHVDHALVARAVRQARPTGRLVAYEDFPYRWRRTPTTCAPATRGADIERWCELASIYKSQIRLMYGSRRHFEAHLRSWSRAAAQDSGLDYAVRFWIPEISRRNALALPL